MKRLMWLFLALALLAGCTPARSGDERAISTVQTWRRTSNSMSVAALMDLKVADMVAQGQNVTTRDWSAERNGSTWMVSYNVHTSHGEVIGQWTLDEESGQVEPANEVARSLDGYEKVVMAKLAPTPTPPVALATPVPQPSASAEATPAPAVTVTVTATPEASATPASPAPTPLPASTASADIELQGVLHLGGEPVAMLKVKGLPYEGHLGDTVGGYKITHIGTRDITVNDHGRPVVIALAPSDGVPRFIPAPDASRPPMAPPSVIGPSQIQTR
ncbi:MAG: hypothetical protein ACYCW6_20710 [Candidatus Xenobia bacterium]